MHSNLGASAPPFNSEELTLRSMFPIIPNIVTFKLYILIIIKFYKIYINLYTVNSFPKISTSILELKPIEIKAFFSTLVSTLNLKNYFFKSYYISKALVII